MAAPPENPKIYHIIHFDRLASVVSDQHLWCDEWIASRPPGGTTIGMSDIKARRLVSELASHPGLKVGQCVPFYFCPRSVMLYLLHKGNHHNLSYTGGQGPILHLEASMYSAIEWAESQDRRWAFTLSNAGSKYFEDRRDLAQLPEVDWNAVHSTQWSGDRQNGKQAEFLLEHSFPWSLIERIGVRSAGIQSRVVDALAGATHRPVVEVLPGWYY